MEDARLSFTSLFVVKGLVGCIGSWPILVVQVPVIFRIYNNCPEPPSRKYIFVGKTH